MKSKKLLKRAVSVLLALSIMLALPVFSFAGQLAAPAYSGQFTTDWLETIEGSNGGARVVLTYGFNTFLINEDVAYGLNFGNQHNSKIINGSGTHNGPYVRAGEWSDLEVRHSGTTVKYYDIW